MKTNRILTFFTIIAMSFAFTSCVQDDDFSVPNSLGNEENARLQTLLATATEVDMAYVKGLYNSDPNNDGDNDDAIPFEVVNDIYVKGYVSSSDQTGNFFKEFYIQDSPSNPTGALKVVLEQVDSYNQFNFGREVYISLKGLFIGEERTGSGVYTIGGGTEFDQYGGTVTRVNQNQIATNLLRSEITEEILPLPIVFSQITDDYVGLFVQVDNVEFADNLNGLRYFDPVQVFDTQRTIQTCSGFGYSELQLETSSFASFKDQLLPTGNGSIKAVLNKTFDGSAQVLALNNVTDVDLNNTRCSLLDPADFSPVFEDTFESYANNAFVAGQWTNYAETGTFRWKVKTTTDSGNPGSKVAWMGAFNSGVPSNIAWLISPAINLDTQDFEFVNFRTSNDFSDTSQLEVLISTNWDGVAANITTATWTTLPATIVSNSEFYQNWIDSGLISLSSYSGTAYIAFKYIGGDNAANTIDGNFELDNFKVLVQN